MKKDSPLYKYMKERMEQDDSSLEKAEKEMQIIYALMFIYVIVFIIMAAVYAFN
jgi:hypothetical protein